MLLLHYFLFFFVFLQENFILQLFGGFDFFGRGGCRGPCGVLWWEDWWPNFWFNWLHVQSVRELVSKSIFVDLLLLAGNDVGVVVFVLFQNLIQQTLRNIVSLCE
jgi:hypothetical protein